MDGILQRLQELYCILDEKSVVAPQPMPRGAKYGKDLLLGFCHTERQRDAVEEMIEQWAKSRGVDIDTDCLAVYGRFDVNRKWFSLSHVEFVSADEYEQHDLQQYIQRFATVGDLDEQDQLKSSSNYECAVIGVSIQTILR